MTEFLDLPFWPYPALLFAILYCGTLIVGSLAQATGSWLMSEEQPPISQSVRPRVLAIVVATCVLPPAVLSWVLCYLSLRLDLALGASLPLVLVPWCAYPLTLIFRAYVACVTEMSMAIITRLLR